MGNDSLPMILKTLICGNKMTPIWSISIVTAAMIFSILPLKNRIFVNTFVLPQHCFEPIAVIGLFGKHAVCKCLGKTGAQNASCRIAVKGLFAQGVNADLLIGRKAGVQPRDPSIDRAL